MDRRLSIPLIRVLVLLMILSTGLSSWASAKPKKKTVRRNRTSYQKQRKPAEPFVSAMVIEAETGRVLFAKSPDTPRAPASLAKLMTTLLTLEAAERGLVAFEDWVTVPPSVRAIRGSRVRLVPGERVTLSDLFRAMFIASANDAAHAVACHIAGSEAAFVKLMNARARELGLHSTRYVNPHGLDRSDRPTSVTTARDQAVLARELIRHPLVLSVASTQADTIRGTQPIRTTNRLLGACPGVDGLKTGYTGKAGFCLASTAEREGMRVISILLGAPSNRRRFSESANLLAQVYSRFEKVPVVRKGQDLGHACRIADGQIPEVQLVAGEDVSVLLPAQHREEIHLQLEVPESVMPPVRQGAPLGRLCVLVGDSLAAAVPAVAAREVRFANLFDRLGQRLGPVD